jgi:hypothetical protein
MEAYEGKEVTFAVPDGWSDRSVVAFSPAQKSNTAGPSIVLTREALKKGDTLRTFAGRQMTELAKGLEHFTMRETRDMTVGGTTAHQYEFTWVGPNGPFFQQMTFAQCGQTVLLFTGTAPQSDAERLRKVFDKALASAKLHEPPPEAEPPQRHLAAVPEPSRHAPKTQAPAPAPAELPSDWWPGATRR